MGIKNYTTIILLDKTSNLTRTYHIKSFYLENKVKFFSGIITFLFLLICFISYLVYSNSKNQIEKGKLDQKIVTLEKELGKLKNNESLKKIEESEQTLDHLESFLKEKGVNVSMDIDENTTKNTGGPYISLEENTDDIHDKYHRINDLTSKIKNIPLGYPHKGNITSTFGVRNNPFGKGPQEQHKGLDFKGNIGEPIKSTAFGTVIFAGLSNGYGNCIIIEHKYGFKTLYGHLSKILTKQGSKVESGSVIGLLGNTGRSSGPHLHYEVRHQNSFLNPKNFLNLK